MFCEQNSKVVIIIRFILHQSIVSKMFLVDALLNTGHLLEPRDLYILCSLLYERKQLFS
jgi:hypothetical protein